MSIGARDAALDRVFLSASDVPCRFQLIEDMAGARGNHTMILAAVAAFEDTVAQGAAVSEELVCHLAVAPRDNDGRCEH